jgi:hypothetical protein
MVATQGTTTSPVATASTYCVAVDNLASVKQTYYGVCANITSSKDPGPAGAVAAIGIGSALFGALLAAFAIFCLLRRRRGEKAYPEENLQSNSTGYIDRDLKGAAVTVAPVNGGVITNVDRLLPQPAEDDAIIGGLSKIRDGIKNHVQNYYYTSPVGPEMVDEARLMDLAEATSIPTSAILGLLLNPATRIPTIRLVLAQLILSRCVGRADGQPSFLPPEVSFLAGYPFATCKFNLSHHNICSNNRT